MPAEKERGHGGRKAEAIWHTPGSPKTMQHRSEIQPGLKLGNQ